MKTFSDLKHRLILRKPKSTQDPLTGEIIEGTDEDWDILGTVWARVRPLRGRELLSRDQILSNTDTEITVRYGELTRLLTQSHSGVCNGIVYNFVSVIQDRLDNRFIQIMAKSGLTNG